MDIQNRPDFIVIDDDKINNMICSKIIKTTFPGKEAKTFTNPLEGLDYIRSSYETAGTNDAILFLDINMPGLSGWDVLDKYKDLPGEVRQHFRIIMLSSSVDFSDKQKAEDNPYVTAYVEKPLTQAKLQSIFNG